MAASLFPRNKIAGLKQMHIFKILGTQGQRALPKQWSNLHINPALTENTQDWGGFYGIVFLCYCGSVVAAISTSS